MEDRHAGVAGGADEQKDEGERREEEGQQLVRPEQQQQRRQVPQRFGHESSDDGEKDFQIIVSIFSKVVEGDDNKKYPPKMVMRSFWEGRFWEQHYCECHCQE